MIDGGSRKLSLMVYGGAALSDACSERGSTRLLVGICSRSPFCTVHMSSIFA